MKIDYEAILKRSYILTKKHKWLWLFGLLVGGGGGASGLRGFTNSASEFQDRQDLQELPAKTAHVLGEQTNVFNDWLSTVSPINWIALGFALSILIVLTIIVSLVLKNWAKGALISGIDMALRGEEFIDLKKTSPHGIRSIKHLIILSFINIAFSIAFFVFVPSIAILIYFVLRSVEVLGILWIILASIAGTIMFIVGIILLAMIGVYAERLITLHHIPPWESWKRSLSLSRGNFFKTLLMGILNMIMSSLIGCATLILAILILGIPTFALLYPSIKSQTFPHPITILMLIFIFLIFVLFNMLVQAFVAVFKYANWNQLFNIVIEHSNNGTNEQ